MTPCTTVPLLWDGDRFRSIADVLPDLAEWDAPSPERTRRERAETRRRPGIIAPSDRGVTDSEQGDP